MVKRVKINGNSVLGVFATCTEEALVVAPPLVSDARHNLESELGVDSTELFIGSSSVVGSLLAGNSTGFVVSASAQRSEIEQLKTIARGIKVRKLPGKINAAGNVILTNDTGAVINPSLIGRAERVIAETLDVDVRRGTIASLKTVGMAACATNSGVLAHPKITEGELSVLSDVFGVPVNIGTINYGSPLIGSSLLANTKGYAVGLETTGIELGRIEETFGFV